jgi:hypothetical protein
MKFIAFYRESNNFDDILTDIVIKKKISVKIFWKQHLYIGIINFDQSNDKIISYITLKFGDSIVDRLCRDRTPIPNIDYIPKRPSSSASLDKPE